MTGPATTRRYPLPAVAEIPAELRGLPQWVAWRWAGKDKLPVDPHSGALAKVNDPSTWGAFQEGCEYAQQHALGIGFVFSEKDAFVGVDLDDIRDPKTGEIAIQDFERILALGSYTEVSPSGTGVKIILKAKLDRAHKEQGLEVYPHGRFFTVTGQRLEGTPDTIEERQTALDSLLVEAFGSNNQHAGPIPEIIHERERNNTLASLAGSLRRRGLGLGVIETTLLEVNQAQCVPPLDEDEVKSIAVSVARYKPDPARYPANPQHNTDLGNAGRFVEVHGADLRYVPLWKSWLFWDGKRWARDDTHEVYRRAEKVIRGMYVAAGQIEDKEGREPAVKWALRSESREKLDAMLTLARNAVEVVVTPDQFDADPWLFNCGNGTIELRTGQLREHRRQDLITKLAPVEHDPVAQCPTWQAFLSELMAAGNDALVQFLRRMAGYMLTGDTSEQCLFMLYGTGANGKSTLLECLRSLLGEYAQQSDFATFLAKDRGGVPNDVARMKGARLVTAVEAGEGRRLAEAMVKQLTGQDTITARFLFSEFFEFKPEFKLLLAVNHKPLIREDTKAMWRRVHLVPFSVSIPEGRQDRKLLGKLKAELPGILAWAVAGCLEWQRSGLGVPEEVRAATNKYRAEMDIIGGFLEACCLITPAAAAGATPLFVAYKRWCEASNEKPMTQTAFGTRLSERGFERRKGSDSRIVWVGLGLLDTAPPDGSDGSDGFSGKSLHEENQLNLPENGSQPSEPSGTQRKCHICGSTDWWQLHGEWVCGTCHPNPASPQTTGKEIAS